MTDMNPYDALVAEESEEEAAEREACVASSTEAVADWWASEKA